MDSNVHPSQCFRWKAYACTGGLPWGVCGFGEGQVVCVCAFIPHRFHRSPTARKSEKGRGGGLAQFHELMKNDLAESSVLCPRLGLDGWGLEGGMRRNIDGKRGRSFLPPIPSPCLLFLCLFLNSFYIVILHLPFVLCLVACQQSLLPIHLFHPIFYLHNLLWTPHYS